MSRSIVVSRLEQFQLIPPHSTARALVPTTGVLLSFFNEALSFFSQCDTPIRDVGTVDSEMRDKRGRLGAETSLTAEKQEARCSGMTSEWCDQGVEHSGAVLAHCLQSRSDTGDRIAVIAWTVRKVFRPWRIGRRDWGTARDMEKCRDGMAGVREKAPDSKHTVQIS